METKMETKYEIGDLVYVEMCVEVDGYEVEKIVELEVIDIERKGDEYFYRVSAELPDGHYEDIYLEEHLFSTYKECKKNLDDWYKNLREFYCGKGETDK